MINSKVFLDSNQKNYRKENFSTCPEDRPLIAQFCGNNPKVLLEAARLVEDSCDAVDLNLGCPQAIAKKGHYGSYLQDDWPLIESIVSTLHTHLKVPVTCKIRVFSDVEKTVSYAKMLQTAGCQLLTVHGRIREQRGHNTGIADWEQIRRVKAALHIPVFANGNILHYADVARCLAYTGCDGVMASEANLANPAIFTPIVHPVCTMAAEYLDICRTYPASASVIRAHLFRLYKKVVLDFVELRERLATAKTFEEFCAVADDLKAALVALHGEVAPVHIDSFDVDANGLPIIPSHYCQPFIRSYVSASSTSVNDTQPVEVSTHDLTVTECLSTCATSSIDMENDACPSKRIKIEK